MLVVGLEVEADCILELAGAPVHPSLELLASQFSKPALHLVDPGRVGRREVQVESGMAEQPALRRRRIVGAEVIEDEVDLEISRHLRIDAVEELPELDRTVASMDLADDRPGRNFECGKERGRAMTQGPLPKPVAVAAAGEEEFGLDYHLAKTSVALRAAFLELRDRILALDGVEEHPNQKGQISYRTTKSFAAFDFRTTVVGVQFKGDAKPPAISGIDIRDIRSRQWGYPWMCSLKIGEDIDKIFELVKSAYTYEQ
jgi:hypothetical protein